MLASISGTVCMELSPPLEAMMEGSSEKWLGRGRGMRPWFGPRTYQVLKWLLSTTQEKWRWPGASGRGGLECGREYWAEATDHQAECSQWTICGPRTICSALPQRMATQRDEASTEAWGKSKARGWLDCEAGEGGVWAGRWLTQCVTAARVWRRQWKSNACILLISAGGLLEVLGSKEQVEHS